MISRSFLCAVVCLATAAGAEDFGGKAEEYLQAAVKTGRFCGSVLVAQKGNILLSKGYGLANAEHDIPNKPSTKFRLGSITKQFTAAAILQLQEQGKLSVNDPIGKYVPNSPDAWKSITIHHLLTHTSGIPSYTNNPAYSTKMREHSKPLDFIGRFRDLPLEFEPGKQYKYNNSGYFLLGVIIEQVSGKSYEQYLKENIFSKLDMQDSGYDWDTTLLKNRAAGYEGAAKSLRNATYLDMSQPYSAGSLYSTVEDMYRWDRALYTTKVLSRESLTAMETPFLSNYGYGVIAVESKGHRVVTHGGGINGFRTSLVRFINDDATVIVLSNFMFANPDKIANDLGAILFGEAVRLPGQLPKEISLDVKSLEKFQGKYTLAGQPFNVYVEEGKLMAKLGPQPPVQLFPYADTKFFLKVVEAEVSFTLGADGRASEAKLDQNGRTQVAKRAE